MSSLPFVCLHAYVYVSVHVCVHAYSVCECVCMPVSVCVYVCAYTFTNNMYYDITLGDTDYNSSAINVTFPIEDISYRAFFEISIYNDNLVEGNETFLLVIDNSSLPKGVSLGRPHQLNVTITEGNGMFV